MKIAIIGSRTATTNILYQRLCEELKSISDIKLIVSGGAVGADTLAEQYAYEHNIEKLIFYPNWSIYGKSAGFIRNKQIIGAADIVIAIWDGKSKGTLSSINIARSQNKEIRLIYF